MEKLVLLQSAPPPPLFPPLPIPPRPVCPSVAPPSPKLRLYSPKKRFLAWKLVDRWRRRAGQWTRMRSKGNLAAAHPSASLSGKREEASGRWEREEDGGREWERNTEGGKEGGRGESPAHICTWGFCTHTHTNSRTHTHSVLLKPRLLSTFCLVSSFFVGFFLFVFASPRQPSRTVWEIKGTFRRSTNCLESINCDICFVLGVLCVREWLLLHARTLDSTCGNFVGLLLLLLVLFIFDCC